MFKLKPKHPGLLLMLINLTVLAVVLQLGWIISEFNFGDRIIGTYVFEEIADQISLWPFIGFAAAQVLLQAILLLLTYLPITTFSKLCKWNRGKTYNYGMFFWLNNYITIFLVNLFCFPHSMFAEKIIRILTTRSHLYTTALYIVLICCISIMSLVFAIALSYAIIDKIKHHKLGSISIIFITLAITLWLSHIPYLEVNTKISSNKKQPNVIIIGLDSIRPDHVGFYSNKKINTPNIDKFLQSATSFSQAYATLARTYVSWNSILTGKWPKNNGVRDNLVDPNILQLDNTLVTRLKNAGYYSLFATDSRQFSIIDQHFKFDKIVSPGLGAYDIIFCTINDFPLSNLIMNTRLGKLLFPYNYGNRMTYATYFPETFNKMLNNALAIRPDKPLFLSLHIILSHWPYVWANDKQRADLPLPTLYKNSVEGIDKQLKQILSILQQHQLLKHAVVVLLSDHGMSIGKHGDRVTNEKYYIGDKKLLSLLDKYNYFDQDENPDKNLVGIDTSNGEGNDILSFNSSNRIIFGIQTFGLTPKNISVDHDTRASLIDVAPTILDMLQLSQLKDIDGTSLKSLLFSANHSLQDRPLFFETGLWFPIISLDNLHNNFDSEYISMKLQHLYRILPEHNLLIMKHTAANRLNKSKQLGVLIGDWFLANYPAGTQYSMIAIPTDKSNNYPCDLKQITKDNKYIICYMFHSRKQPLYVLVNQKTHYWTMDLNSEFAAQAPLEQLKRSFNKFYHKNL